jgi:murein L,D-transpeptidase YafK
MVTMKMNRLVAKICSAPLVALLVSPVALADGAVYTGFSGAEDPWTADRVLVVKSERQLYLMRGDAVLRKHRISLGQSPVGPKRQEGDNRTPEGDYVLDWRNPNSDFYMAMHISYPNDNDRREARRRGVDPGNMIMIHGLPNDSEPNLSDYLGEDWTNGCIAVSNQAMIDIWLSVKDNTPITILP